MAEESGQPVGSPAPAPEAPAPDYKDLYLRAVAELDNYRKRVEKDRAALSQMAAEAVIRRLLEPLDSFERAISDLARLKGESPAELQGALTRSIEGLRALQRQLSDALAAEGLQPIKAEGAEFDPAVHEALIQMPHPTAPAGTVIEVLRPGYTMRGRLMRAASVAVSSGPAAPAEADDARPAHPSAPAKGTPNEKSH